MSLKMTPGTVEGDHVLLTGPIQGVVELEDGRVVDVSPAFIAVDDDDAEEICHRIGIRHMLEGHPSLVDRDEETGEMVQRPFHYVPPKRFHKDLEGKKALGTPREGAGPEIHPDHSKGFVPEPKKD